MKNNCIGLTLIILLLIGTLVPDPAYCSDGPDIGLKKAYIEGDYVTSAKLLKKYIGQYRGNNITNNYSDLYNLYRKNMLLAFIYTWRLGNPEAALSVYKNVTGIRQFFRGTNKIPPFEFMYIAEIYEKKNKFSGAGEYYHALLNALTVMKEIASDDTTINMASDLINLIKYRIDGLPQNASRNMKRKQLLNEIKLPSVHSMGIPMESARLVAAATEYDLESLQKIGLVKYIEQSPVNLSSMIMNYAFILNAASGTLDESVEKALKLYLKKYPESYYSLLLRHFFYRLYKENNMDGKSLSLLKELTEIAKKRQIRLVTDN